jgi:hypothetical protein
MAFFGCGGTRLMLSLAQPSDATCDSIIYYKTESLEEMVNTLKSRGAGFESERRMIAKTGGQ